MINVVVTSLIPLLPPLQLPVLLDVASAVVATAVLVAHTVQEDGDCTGGFVIPRANIVSLKTLAVPD